MTKPLVAIKAENTVIGFGEPQKDDAIGVSSGGLGINYVSPNTLLLGNNSSSLKPIGMSNINSSLNLSVTSNLNTLIGNIPITLEVQEEELILKNLKGLFPFSRIGQGRTDAVMEEAADDFGSYDAEGI